VAGRATAVRLPVAVLPEPAPDQLVDAIHAAGGRREAAGRADGLVWLGTDPAELAAGLARWPSVGWVQLSAVGVEGYLPLMADGRQWTCARGVHDVPAAEHALMLALACLRGATRSVRSRRWSPQPPVQLSGEQVLVVGGGSIATALLALLRPFDVRATVVRRRPVPMPGAVDVVPPRLLDEVLPHPLVMFLAAPLTRQTEGLMDRGRLRLMRPDACLVNVSRGPLVVTDDLVAALSSGRLAAAGLDVTDPEPLPPGHRLWDLPNCLITAHCGADLTRSMPAFVELVGRNVRRRLDGRPLLGLVDATAGY
jgi:phosphoglycerate dehydrogenase-like enzyme